MSRLSATLCVLFLAAAVVGAQKPEASVSQANPLLKEWTTPFGVPPFDEIKPEHFLPGLQGGHRGAAPEVDAIVANPGGAHVRQHRRGAGERRRAARRRSGSVFCEPRGRRRPTTQLQAINREVAPMLAALAGRHPPEPEAVRAGQGGLGAARPARPRRAAAQAARGDLQGLRPRAAPTSTRRQKERLRAINAELSSLGVQFGDNLLHETNAYRLVIDRQEDLAGLPPAVVAAPPRRPKAAKLAASGCSRLQAPSIWPFLQYADNRELRRQILTAYTTPRRPRRPVGQQGERWRRIAALRAERAQLLGYKTYADFVLEENMAKTPDSGLRAAEPALDAGARDGAQEAATLQADGPKRRRDFKLEPWDWRYYAEKVRKARYDLDEEALRPYFQLDSVREGAFDVAGKLYGLTFVRAPRPPDVPPRGQDVRGQGRGRLAPRHLLHRLSTRGRASAAAPGASTLPRAVGQGRAATSGRSSCNVCNFPRPTGDTPALLSLEEVETLFHEFGHALHSLLSPRAVPQPRRRAARLRRAAVADHGELGARARGAEGLREALQDRRGRSRPTWSRRSRRPRQFNQGFATVEYLAASSSTWTGTR